MLVIINFKGDKSDFIPKFEKMSQENQRWLAAKYEGRAKADAIEMDLHEAIRLLTAFNSIEKIHFEIR